MENVSTNNTDFDKLTEETTYSINNNTFIVETVFKTERAETLGEVLLRLIIRK